MGACLLDLALTRRAYCALCLCALDSFTVLTCALDAVFAFDLTLT